MKPMKSFLINNKLSNEICSAPNFALLLPTVSLMRSARYLYRTPFAAQTFSCFTRSCFFNLICCIISSLFALISHKQEQLLDPGENLFKPICSFRVFFAEPYVFSRQFND